METARLATLVAGARAGDQAAWDEIVARFAGLVWTIVRRAGLPPDEAADVAQLVWLRLVERLGSLRDPQRLGGWLATTARREAWEAARRAGRAPLPAGDDLPEPGQEPGDGPVDVVLGADRDARVRRALGRLSPRCQDLLLALVADEEPEYRQIAEALGMPVGSIGPTRGRCLDRLRAELVREDAGVPEGDHA